MKQMTAVRMALCPLFTALVVIGTFLQILLPNLDYSTLQFFFVLIIGILLGARLGALSATLCVLIGLLGIPIFTAGGGISYVPRPSFRFLLGFIVTAFCSGWIMRHGQRGQKTYFLAVLAGLLATYRIGLAYEYVILSYYTGTGISFSLLLLSCLPLGLPKDILRSILTAYVALYFPVAVCRGIKQERVYTRQIQE